MKTRPASPSRNFDGGNPALRKIRLRDRQILEAPSLPWPLPPMRPLLLPLLSVTLATLSADDRDASVEVVAPPLRRGAFALLFTLGQSTDRLSHLRVRRACPSLLTDSPLLSDRT